MFITPDTAVTYTRDRLLSLRNHAAPLNHDQRSLVSQLGLCRRGCRAGAHCQRRLQLARSVTSSTTRTSTRGEIPTIVGHRVVFVNKHQLIDARHDVGRANLLKSVTEANSELTRTPSSLSFQTAEDVHLGHHTHDELSLPPCVGHGTELTARTCPLNQLSHQPIVSSPLHLLDSNTAPSTTPARDEVNVVSISTNRNVEEEDALNGSLPAVIMSKNPSPQSVSTYISPKSLSAQRSTLNL